MSLENVPLNDLGYAVLSQLHRRCFLTEWKASEFKNILTMPGAFAQVIRDTTDPPLLLVGFVLARIVKEDGEIISMGVLPNYRGRGFGRKLVYAVEAQSRLMGARKVFLEVAETNDFGMRLYKSSGFKIVGRRQGYYKNKGNSKTDALIMRRCFE